MLSVGSHAYVTHTVRDSAQCLGGVQLLFPLLARLPGAASTEAAASGAVGDDAADGKSGGDGGFSGSSSPLRAEQLLVQLLGLMSQMLWDSTADQHFMLRRHGFAIFVFLLRQLPPVLWTVQAVTACVQLTSCFSSIEALHHEAVWLLFGAPRLWIFTALEVWPARRQRSSALPASPAARPPTRARPSRRAPVAAHAGAQVQLEVYEVLQTVIGLKPRAFLAPTFGTSEPLLTIQALLDMLEVFYWRQPSAASFARQPLRHAISGDVIGERPGIDGLRRLRKKVMLLLQVRADAPARWTPRGAHHTIPPSHHPSFSSIPSHHPHSHRGLHVAPITPSPLHTIPPSLPSLHTIPIHTVDFIWRPSHHAPLPLHVRAHAAPTSFASLPTSSSASTIRSLCPQVLAEAELSRADVACLLAVLRNCRDAWVLKDVVTLLMEWLTPVNEHTLSHCGTMFVRRLTELSQASEETMYDTLVDLMHGDAEVLRLASLRLLGLLLGAAPDGLRPHPAVWSRVTHALGGNPLSATTYSALIDTLVGQPHSVIAAASRPRVAYQRHTRAPAHAPAHAPASAPASALALARAHRHALYRLHSGTRTCQCVGDADHSASGDPRVPPATPRHGAPGVNRPIPRKCRHAHNGSHACAQPHARACMR